tara:strand:- start:1060 stop:1341 length:282 start_codon:yes stop_codon:yes gene_type:complete
MTTDEKPKLDPTEYSIGDMIGMKFQYFNQVTQTMDNREIRGIIMEKDNSEGWKLLLTYDTHKGTSLLSPVQYSISWLRNRNKSDSLWRVTDEP